MRNRARARAPAALPTLLSTLTHARARPPARLPACSRLPKTQLFTVPGDDEGILLQFAAAQTCTATTQSVWHAISTVLVP